MLFNDTQDGSGWVLDGLEELRLMTINWRPVKGSRTVLLPSWIEKQGSCYNVQNMNDECFRYNVHVHYHHQEFETRVEKENPENYEQFGHEVCISTIYLVDLCTFKSYL